MITFWVTWS